MKLMMNNDWNLTHLTQSDAVSLTSRKAFVKKDLFIFSQQVLCNTDTIKSSRFR